MNISYFKAPAALAACWFPVQAWGCPHWQGGLEQVGRSVEKVGLVTIYTHMLFIFCRSALLGRGKLSLYSAERGVAWDHQGVFTHWTAGPTFHLSCSHHCGFKPVAQ